MKRTCKVCQEELTGRSDQKFCSDHCRSYYHNARWRSRRKQWLFIHSAIRKNRDILERFSNSGGPLSFDLLIKTGFNPGYLTYLDESKGSRPVFWTYDLGYQLNPDNTILIVKADTLE